MFTVLYFYVIKRARKQASQLTHPAKATTKPIVTIIIDSLMDAPLHSAISNNKAPALKFLIDQGQYFPKMISSFPTMSVSIDSTFLTGTYPNQHKVPALVWYDSTEKRFISYGSAKGEIMKIGVKKVLKNSIFDLNHKHLNQKVKTLHEEIDGPTGSINALVYRGKNIKSLYLPFNLAGATTTNRKIKTPTYFSYGLLSLINLKNKFIHLWQAFGFNDKFATEELLYLIKNDRLPTFSLVYYSDNDKKVHKHGEKTTKGIEDVDIQLQQLLNQYESWDQAIKENIWIVMGDSGQTKVKATSQEALIDLRKVLNDYQIYKITGSISNNDQIVIGLNERMSFIYILDETLKIEEVIDKLLKDKRIDHIAWKVDEKICVVSTSFEGKLSYKPTGIFLDDYNQAWEIEGNNKILDLTLAEKRVSYGEYPDGLARLYSSLHSHTGTYLVINAKPGYEFVGEGSPTHVGGASHGSLHQQDSYFPMIVVGTEQKPEHERIVDLKEWILQIIKE